MNIQPISEESFIATMMTMQAMRRETLAYQELLRSKSGEMEKLKSLVNEKETRMAELELGAKSLKKEIEKLLTRVNERDVCISDLELEVQELRELEAAGELEGEEPIVQ